MLSAALGDAGVETSRDGGSIPPTSTVGERVRGLMAPNPFSVRLAGVWVGFCPRASALGWLWGRSCRARPDWRLCSRFSPELGRAQPSAPCLPTTPNPHSRRFRSKYAHDMAESWHWRKEVVPLVRKFM